MGNREMLIKFTELLANDKVYQLAQVIEQVNPKGALNNVKKLEM